MNSQRLPHRQSKHPVRRQPINRKAGFRYLSLFLPGMVLLAFSFPSTGVSRTDDLATEQMQVRELMRLDTARALDEARSGQRKDNNLAPSADQANRYTQSGSLKLVAIYGVGTKLLAEVLVGQQPHMYVRGRALPIGLKGGDTSAYMLRGISGSCVHLERKSESHILCLQPALGTSK